jgi:hypothetical protein
MLLDESKFQWPVYGDPVSQASMWLPEELYDWQKRILIDCTKWGARVAVVTPNESGKTSIVIPLLGLAWMTAFPGAQVVSTAGVERQIKEGLWPVLTHAISQHREWKTRSDELKIEAPSIEGIPGSTWEMFTTKDPEYAEGFHPRNWKISKGPRRGEMVYGPLLVIVDEAKSFQGDKGVKMINTFVRRCSPDAMLIISTPGHDEGPFYDCLNKNRGQPWVCHEITWDDCPHLQVGFKLEEREQAIKELGRTHPFVKSWIFGEFFRREDLYVFDMDKVNIAMSGIINILYGEKFGAMEFSGGGDEQVFGVREGNQVIHLEAMRERDTMVLGDKYIKLIKRFQIPSENLIADEGGLGKPIIDYIERKLQKPIRRYMFSAAPRDKRRYANRATEDCFRLRQLVHMNAVNLPNDPTLKDQFRKRKYQFKDEDNKIMLEPKTLLRNRREESPDRLDIMIMLFADMPLLASEFRKESANPHSKCGSYMDCHKPSEDDLGEMTIWMESFF